MVSPTFVLNSAAKIKKNSTPLNFLTALNQNAFWPNDSGLPTLNEKAIARQSLGRYERRLGAIVFTDIGGYTEFTPESETWHSVG